MPKYLYATTQFVFTIELLKAIASAVTFFSFDFCISIWIWFVNYTILNAIRTAKRFWKIVDIDWYKSTDAISVIRS